MKNKSGNYYVALRMAKKIGGKALTSAAIIGYLKSAYKGQFEQLSAGRISEMAKSISEECGCHHTQAQIDGAVILYFGG